MPFMKRVFHWLDENLEEFLLVIGLYRHDADHGSSGFLPLRSWHVAVVVGRADQIYFYLVRFF